MLGIIAFAAGYVMGLGSAVFFVVGFAMHKKIEATGFIFRSPKVPEPMVNDSREAIIERARAEAERGISLEEYES